ncbi:hypothetical protein AKJ16_DCAP23015, partial [Drosera capensis]
MGAANLGHRPSRSPIDPTQRCFDLRDETSVRSTQFIFCAMRTEPYGSKRDHIPANESRKVVFPQPEGPKIAM